jgi:hypothetical protein
VHNTAHTLAICDRECKRQCSKSTMTLGTSTPSISLRQPLRKVSSNSIDTTHRQLYTTSSCSSVSIGTDLEFDAERKASGDRYFSDLRDHVRSIGQSKCPATHTLTLAISRPSLKEQSMGSDVCLCADGLDGERPM